MADLHFLSQELLCNDMASDRLCVSRCVGAEIIWVKADAAACDRAYGGDPADEQAYRAHLLRSCAFLASSDAHATDVAWADRYGGAGLGGNGGSGRSANLHGYNVKGVGPTTLIGRNNSPAHSSGGAFMGEAIREIAFAELLQEILPHGSSPILALIDTHVDHRFMGPGDVPDERRVLMVRPTLLRPAHLQRAYRFASSVLDQRRVDKRRVQHNVERLFDALGVGGALDLIEDAYAKWAEQLACGVVSGLALGLSPSNLTLEGRVLDFGATSTLPVPANYSIAPGNSTAMDVPEMMASLEEVLSHAADAGSSVVRERASWIEAAVFRAYERGLATALIRAAGFASSVDGLSSDDDLVDEIVRIHASYRRRTTRLRMNLLPSRYAISHPFSPALDEDVPGGLQSALASVREVLSDRRRDGASQEGMGVWRWRWTSEDIREMIDRRLEDAAGDVDVSAILSLVSATLRS